MQEWKKYDKIINNDAYGNNSLIEQCVNLLKELDHQNLPKVHDAIEGEDHIYVIMDYIEGESLKKKIAREKVISHEEVIDYVPGK